MSTAFPNTPSESVAGSTAATRSPDTRPDDRPGDAGRSPFTDISSSRKTTNSVMGLLMWVCMIIALIPLLWLLFTVVSRGWGAVTDLHWWTHDMVGVRARSHGGGALHAIAGTIMQTLIASVFSTRSAS